MQITEAPPLDRVSRLDIYAEGYFARMVEVLADDFENLHRALTSLFEEMAFRTIISAYLTQHPSTTRTICDIGQHLPEFLESYGPVAEFPYLASIAWMDWCATRTLYIDSLPSFDAASLTELTEDDWIRLKFDLDPTVQFVSVPHAVDQLWSDPDLDPREIAERPTTLLIFRQDELVHVESITTLQVRVLRRMQEQKSLGEICEELEAEIPNDDDMPPLMEWFGQWTQSGVIRAAKL